MRLYTVINIEKLKQNLMKEKSIQIFIMIKSQKKAFIALVYHWFWLTLLLKWVKLLYYYPELLLEECKYIVKEKEVTRHVTEDRDILSDDSDKSDEEWFFFNKHSKKSYQHKNFELCESLPSLDYKEVFLTTINIRYKDHHSLLV